MIGSEHAGEPAARAGRILAGVHRDEASQRPSQRRLRLCFVGWGAIAQRAGSILLERDPNRIEIAAVAVQNVDRPRHALPDGAKLLSSADELAGLDLDLVIEAAGRPCVAQWAEAAIRSGADFLISSTSAFCDEALLHDLRALAEDTGRKIFIPPGALGGMDALGAASLTQLSKVEHSVIKPPAAWRSTAAEDLIDLDSLTRAETFFSGSARDAADKFPKNANVAIISAMAGIGLDQTRVVLIADPAATRNSHHIVAEGAFGRMEVQIENAALAANPKSSEMTALNLVRAIERMIDPVVC